jgi:gliding motility-associated-like protein
LLVTQFEGNLFEFLRFIKKLFYSMRKLLTILFSVISFIASSQNCPDLGPDQFLTCGQGSTVLTANLTSCVGGIGPKQTTDYSVSPIPYVAQTNTGTQLFMTDDSQQGPFNIGFNFCFFGTTYTQFYIGSNGWISFSPGQPTTFSSQLIPTVSALVPKNCIMGPWQDWHPGIGGQIRYQMSGVAPCRKLTVSWIGVPMFQCTGNQGTFHIVIYESTNNIENYIQDKPACLSWQGGTAVEGVHNNTGTIGIPVPGRNSTAWVANNDAWKWTPNGPTVNPVLTWYQVGNPIAIGTGTSITVTPPPAGAQYTCRFVYPICNAGWNTCNTIAGPGPDTVLVVPGPPNLLPANMTFTNPICFGGCDGTATATPVNGSPIYNFLWSNSQTTQTATNLCPGTYTVLITDANGCSGTSTVTLTNPPMIVTGPINFSDTICFNSTNEVYTVPNSPGYTYTWSTVGGITYGQGTDSINVDWTGVPSGFIPTGVIVTATDANGCVSLPVSVDLNVLNITPTITPIGPLCSNDPCINLNGSPIGGQFTGDCVTTNQFCPDQSVNTNNNIVYTYTLSGCAFTTPATVIVNQQPVISGIVPDDELIELCDGDSINRIYSVASIFMGYNDWTVLGQTTQSTSLNMTWDQLGIYTISVIRYSNGCPSEPQTTTVNLVECPRELIYIPNSFTPDGDEHNNVWLPVFTSGYDEYDYNLVIYNRWGETIFESNKANYGWDGTYNNVMCPAGIYVWRITYGNKKDDSKKVITGNINLIR